MATQNNKKILHRKEWQAMSKAPANSAAGSFIIKDPLGIMRTTFFVLSATAHYLYAADEDAWMQTPSMALAGTFGAGACGAWGCWSNTLTANGGSTTTVTTATGINDGPVGLKIRFLTGSQAGKEVTVTAVKVVPGGTNTLTFTPELSGAIVNTDTFAVSTGRYFVMDAGTIAAGIFKSIDPLTGAITSLGTTGLPATWGTDGRLISTPSYVGAYATGTATSATGTTLVNSAKAWGNNQWCNYQVRITAGTGIGQIRTITSNNGTTLTVPTWTVTPDSTSVYAIEANDDFLYLLGNNAVTMYRYSISGGTWSTLAPTTARAGAPIAGMGANWLGKTNDAIWGDENAILDGRYIFSFRGGSAVLDRYDIAGGTAGAGAWAQITYIGATETFSTGSSYDADCCNIYIRKESTGRFFKYNAIGNNIYPFATDDYPDGTAILGDKLFTVAYTGGTGDDTINWLYYLANTSTPLRRIMIF